MNIFDINRMITETLEKKNINAGLFVAESKANILKAISEAKNLILLEQEEAEEEEVEEEEFPGVFAAPSDDLNLGFGDEDEKLDEADIEEIARSRRANELAGTKIQD